MLSRFRLFMGIFVICIAISQIVGCFIPKNLIKFTGHWVEKQDPYDATKKIRACVEGGYQCAVTSSGLEVEITSEIEELLNQQ